VRMMRVLLSALIAVVRAILMPRATLALENAALRQQLAVYLLFDSCYSHIPSWSVASRQVKAPGAQVAM